MCPDRVSILCDIQLWSLDEHYFLQEDPSDVDRAIEVFMKVKSFLLLAFSLQNHVTHYKLCHL